MKVIDRQVPLHAEPDDRRAITAVTEAATRRAESAIRDDAESLGDYVG
jgi:hypothetical protein